MDQETTPAGTEAGARLLAWYDRHARKLPWRLPPGTRSAPDPYRIWLSEVMLQQTTVAAVIPYFHAFLSRWPTVADLAAAPEEEVMKAWAGLGYYRRARNLKRCAEVVAADHGGRFPARADALGALPGIGAYTSAAIAAIAFDTPVVVVDGNVERVASRLLALDAPPKTRLAEINAVLDAMMPVARPGDFAQAMMDLGATICTPKRPACGLCPLAEGCLARLGEPEAFPVKAARRVRPLRRGAAFVGVRADGAVLLRRRAAEGLLGGMSEVPTTTWRTDHEAGDAAVADDAPLPLAWRRLPAPVSHGFTHFLLELDVFRADAPTAATAPDGCWWSPAAAVSGEALPTVMRKVLAAACPQLDIARRVGRP